MALAVLLQNGTTSTSILNLFRFPLPPTVIEFLKDGIIAIIANFSTSQLTLQTLCLVSHCNCKGKKCVNLIPP